MAEIEFSVLFGQALNKRIPNQETLKKEIKVWQDNRNTNTKTIDWKFTTKDARVKLKKTLPYNSRGIVHLFMSGGILELIALVASI